MYYYSNTELGLDYFDFMEEHYLPEDYLPEEDDYYHDFKNDDNYELPF
jgi:hypothetical protein